METDSLEPLFGLVLASHLIDDIRLRACAAEFKQDRGNNGAEHDELTEFRDFLISRKILTEWQCEKLSAGKYKGFFLDQYIMLERLATAELSNLYSARDRRTGEVVTLDVTFPTGGSTDIRYEVKSRDGDGKGVRTI